MTLPYYTQNLPDDVLLDTGVLLVGNQAWGASQGGLTFDPGREMRNVPFDGKRSDVAGLDRITRWNSQITGQMLVFGPASLLRLEPGVSVTSGVYTPADGGLLIAVGDLLDTVKLAFQRGSGGVAVVIFDKGLVNTYTVAGQVDGEALVNVTVAARLVVEDNNTDACPYRIELLDTIS